MPDQQRGLERGCGVCICPRSLNGPTPELILRSVQPSHAVNGIGEVAPPLSLSFLPRTTLNKDTGLIERPWVEAHRSRSQGATTSDSAIFARSFSRGLAVSRSGVTGMACLPSLIGMRGRCAVVEEQDCWLLVTRCVAGRVALARQAVVVGLLPRRLDRGLISRAIMFCGA